MTIIFFKPTKTKVVNLDESDSNTDTSDSCNVLDDQSLEFGKTAAGVDDLLSLGS